jgi:hypothetical protein
MNGQMAGIPQCRQQSNGRINQLFLEKTFHFSTISNLISLSDKAGNYQTDSNTDGWNEQDEQDKIDLDDAVDITDGVTSNYQSSTG